MADHHRKIELQSPDDLSYLITTALAAAHQKIDRDLPATEGEDPFRRRVEELVHQYISDVFLATGKNITINGMDVDAQTIRRLLEGDLNGEARMVEEWEAFDMKKWERAKELARQEEDLVEEIAALRRNVPAATVAAVKSGYKSGIEGDEAELEKMAAKGRETGVDMGVLQLERQDAVEASWKKSIESLGRLKRTMPEMVAKTDRAKEAEKYVMSM